MICFIIGVVLPGMVCATLVMLAEIDAADRRHAREMARRDEEDRS